jgi:hypothetical protein
VIRGLKNLSLIAFSAVFALAAVEAGFRLFNIYPSVSGPPRYLAVSDQNFVYRLQPVGVWSHASWEFSHDILTNQNGYRGPEWNFDAPGIAILGSSEVFGFCNTWTSTFPGRLQAMADNAGFNHQTHTPRQ